MLVVLLTLSKATFTFVVQPKMLASAFRAVARPAVSAARSSLRPATAVRSFSVTARAQSGGPPPPQLYGTGAQPGTVPPDLEQATGLERLQLLGDMEGVSVFDDQPLDASRLGTKADPIKVLSYVRLPYILSWVLSLRYLF